MKIGFIGNEPSGPVLAKAWAQAGHEVIGFVAFGDEVIEGIESLLPATPLISETRLLAEADLILLAVANDDVESACDQLVGLGQLGPQKLVVHTSPLRGYGALASAGAAGAVPIARPKPRKAKYGRRRSRSTDTAPAARRQGKPPAQRAIACAWHW